MNDTEFIIQLLNTPGWLQFIGDKNVKTEEQAIDYLEKGPIKSYRENGFGLCLVEKKEDGIPIGTCGILKRDSLDQPDLGFAFLPEFQGMGYAYEVADATIQHGFSHFKLSELLAVTKPNNHKSISLLKKLGFTYSRFINVSTSEEELALYNLKSRLIQRAL